MKAIIILRHPARHLSRWWATVRSADVPYEAIEAFCYDTPCYRTKTAALKEARAFCRWKQVRVARVVEQ